MAKQNIPTIDGIPIRINYGKKKKNGYSKAKSGKAEEHGNCPKVPMEQKS
jgi:hypothetical protein